MEEKTIDHHLMLSLQKIEFNYEGPEQPSDNQMTTIADYNKDLLISVGRGHGGLYIFNPNKNRFQRKYSGIFAGLIKYKDGFMALRQPNELVVFDEDLKIKSVVEIQDKSISGLHGLKLSDDGLIYIISSTQNKIIVYEEQSLDKHAEYTLSTAEKDVHHINDLFVTKDTLLLSMFSVSGGWKEKPPELWDGAIVAFDRHEFNPKGIVIDNLMAPHSITIINDSIYYCDSLNLNVSKFDMNWRYKEVVAQFTGFTRGLHFDNNILVVGQSKMRHLQHMYQKFPNISVDGGVHLYDFDKQISRFIKLPVGNPYAIVPY
ncbi:DUF4915 domain-containing protein [Scopulibacillus cellulosilyticus]|uniref:DUF4915 domain-containing protein n=1 Tax=Scopulibacillus cellulosilyticus TaxID=2665665 RepID=A0ABW2Q4K1_9BACL